MAALPAAVMIGSTGHGDVIAAAHAWYGRDRSNTGTPSYRSRAAAVATEACAGGYTSATRSLASRTLVRRSRSPAPVATITVGRGTSSSTIVGAVTAKR